jgi:hypothetical protein
MQIRDLSKTLDSQSMTAVRGGDNGNSATNTIGQTQKIYAPVGVAGYGPSNTSVHVNGTQDASIFNDQFGGDSFFALPLFPVIRGL